MSVHLEHSISNRRFEQFMVLVFLLLPPIGGLMVLAKVLSNPTKFGLSLLYLGAIIAVVGIHIKWVRPYFRRYPWVATYRELAQRSKPLKARHPKLVAQAYRHRLMRSGYRILITALVLPPFYGLYTVYGHHFLWFFFGYLVCGFGITVGYHRIGTHPSFKAPVWVRGFLLAMGSCAMQGPASEWLKKHSKHHAFGETTADPHSPHIFEDTKRGIFKEHVMSFLHSFIMWAFREPSLRRPPKMGIEEWRKHLLANPPSMETFRFREEDRYHWEVRDKNGNIVQSTEQMVQRRWNKLVDTLVKIEQDKTVQFVSHPLVYLSILGASIFAPYYLGGISGWESLARICFTSYVTFCVNSMCHIWGEQPFKVPDNSRNNAVVEILGLGEGGHNTHHKAELWARHGVFSWQFDPSAYFIRGLSKIGLAWDLNLPTREQIVSYWRQWRRREPDAQGLPVRPHHLLMQGVVESKVAEPVGSH